MLFLVRITLRAAMDEEIGRLLQLIEAEWEVVEDLVGRHQVRACGKFADSAGAVAIFEMPGEDAVRETVARLPLAPYFESVEVRRLVPPDRALRTARRRRHAYETIAARRHSLRGATRDGDSLRTATRA